MDFAVRDIDWEGAPAVQLQGLLNKKRVHMTLLAWPDKEKAIERASAYMTRRGVEPYEVAADDWIEPNERDVWKHSSFFGVMSLSAGKNSLLCKFYSASPAYHDETGAHTRILLDAASAREMAKELNRLADMMEAV